MLAILLLTQGLLFLWLTDRIFGAAPRTPAQLAANVADEVGTELQQRPDSDLEAFIRDRFSHIYQPFLVVLTNGQRASNRPSGLPPEFARAVQGRIRGEMFGGGRPGEPGFSPRSGPGGEPGRGDTAAPRPQTGDGTTAPAIEPRTFPGGGPGGPGPGGGFGRRGGPRFPIEYATITAGDRQVGVVAVPSNPPPVSVALRELGPTLTWVGLGLLGLGTTLTALFVFRPVHKRLRTLEHAARALGEGRTDVRATETGGDEVSSLARTFNRMAIDLESRATALAASDRDAPPAAGRRVARVDDAAVGDSRLRRNARHGGSAASIRTPASATSTSSNRKRTNSKRSSVTCSISRDSRAAAIDCAPSRWPSPISSGGFPIDMSQRCAIGVFRSSPTSHPIPRRFLATRAGSSRRCRTSPRTPSAIHRPMAAYACQPHQLTTAFGSPFATAAPEFHRSTCRASSIGFTRWMPRAPALPSLPAAAWACRSSGQLSNVTAAA